MATLAQYIGILAAMIVTPMLIIASPSDPGYGSGIDSMLLLRERPKTPPSSEPYQRISFSSGLKHIFSLRDMWIMIILFTVGLGIFNAISSMVDSVANYLGVDDSNGLIGGLMLIGGIIGAIIIPVLSDIYKKRKLFLVI
jgi:Na+/melibiose symporter-like transporter